MDFTILIADDNRFIRENLCSNIDWASLGITKVLSAHNGEAARQLIMENKPQIVISDIVMPMLTGVDLAREIRQSEPDISFILISAYDEFEYARQAINTGVYAYVLKPVDKDNLISIVKRCIDEKVMEAQLRTQVKNGMDLLRERFYIRCVEGGAHTEQWQENADYLGVAFKQARYSCILFDIDGKEKLKAELPIEDFEVLLLRIRNIVEGHLQEKHLHLFNTKNDLLEAILGYESSEDFKEIYNCLEIIKSEVESQCKTTISIACGNGVDAIESIQSSHQEAVGALEYRFMAGLGHTLVYSDFAGTASQHSMQVLSLEKQMVKALRFGSHEKLAEFFEVLESQLKTSVVKRDFVYATIFSLALKAYQTVCETLSEAVYEINYITELYTILNKFSTNDAMLEWFEQLIVDFMNQLTQTQQGYLSEVITKTKNYIDNNFCIEDLNLEMIANEVSFSQSYISLFFKKETGVNLFDYIIQMRIERAVHLLNTTDERISVIGAQIGYPNPSYFSNMFKKHVGISPKEYRDNLKNKRVGSA